MTELLIALFLIQGQSAPLAPPGEIAVLGAVVAHLPATSRCTISRFTFSHPQRWTDGRTVGTGWHVIGESPTPVRVSESLISAAQAANNVAVSLDALWTLHAFPLSAGLTWAHEDNRGDCIIRMSRPGVSDDATHALVDVRVEDSPCRCPHGHVYTVEKRSGTMPFDISAETLGTSVGHQFGFRLPARSRAVLQRPGRPTISTSCDHRHPLADISRLRLRDSEP